MFLNIDSQERAIIQIALRTYKRDLGENLEDEISGALTWLEHKLKVLGVGDIPKQDKDSVVSRALLLKQMRLR